MYDWIPARPVLSPLDADTDGLLARLRSLAASADHRDPVIRARLRCAYADAAVPLEGTREELERSWQQLVRAAAAGRFRGARALVASRAAYAFAARGDGEQAENLWRQAVLASSEEQLYGDARGAMRSLQYLAIDQGRPLGGPNGATGGLPDRKRLLAAALDPALSALEAAHHGRLPDALGDVRRYLWEARLSGDRREEASAQALLGDVLSTGGHHLAATHYYLEAGAGDKAAAAVRALPRPFDVTNWLNSPVRHRQAASIAVMKAQAAALPDTVVPESVRQLLEHAATVWAAPHADPAPERQALNAVAAFGRRIPESAVDTILALARPATATPAPASWVVVAPVVANLLIQAYWARGTTTPRNRPDAGLLAGAASAAFQPVAPDARDPRAGTRALTGHRALPRRGRRPGRPACPRALARGHARGPDRSPSSLRRAAAPPRGHPSQRCDPTQATETVDFLKALLKADTLIDVSPDDLGPDQAQPAGRVVLQIQLNPPADTSSTQVYGQPTAQHIPDQAAIQTATGPDQAALLASGPLPALAEAIARHLLAMAEDTHDTSPSRIQAIDALRALAFHLPGPVLFDITDRMLIVSRNPGLPEFDRLTLEASGAFSRGRLNLGITHLPGMALVLATDAFIQQRDRQSPLAAQETAFADEVMASSAALMRDPDAEVRKLGAIAMHDLAHGAPDAAVQTTGMLSHPDPQVRVLGASIVPLTPDRQALLASDPALEVRQALSDRLTAQSPTAPN
ncbi:hypothetical protein [Streptomyces longisporus]|uniref:Uncharacterized protein n=1 Tax=Streptomyces longisporus TaxID=1948 RepID=A0ABN3M7P8_STRLO